jgi:hypothetical protein
VWRHAVEDGVVALARPNWGDAKWSYLYDKATRYRAGGEAGTNGTVAEAARAARGGDEVPVAVSGPVINAAVWTWEVPLYFWFGGIATGSSFIALACDAAGDHRSARVARMVALGAIGPGSPLWSWTSGAPCASSTCCASSSRARHVDGRVVPERLLGRDGHGGARRPAGPGEDRAGARCTGRGARDLPGLLHRRAAVGHRGPRLESQPDAPAPIFICTGAATGAAANRLVLSALGVPAGHPTRRALGAIETLAMTTELGLSHLNEKRLGDLGHALEEGRPGRLFRFAKSAVMGGLALRGLGSRLGTAPGHVSSALFLAAGLAFRFAWVGAGRTSASDHEAVARTARRRRV